MPSKHDIKSIFTFHFNSVIPYPLPCLFTDDQNAGTVGYVANQMVLLNIMIGPSILIH